MIGKTLQKKRKSKGFKQEWVSHKTGLSQCHISAIENGNRDTSIEILDKFAEAYDVSPVSELIEKHFEE